MAEYNELNNNQNIQGDMRIQNEQSDWKERREQRMKEITGLLETGVAQMFTTDEYTNYLNTMAKFHSYSFNNSMLIAMQKPDATLVAGYDAWEKKFNRHVKRGEKGIQILAPVPRKEEREVDRVDPVTNQVVIGADGKPEKKTIEVTVPRFRIATVFDISQTYGEPLPQLDIPELLGSAENYDIFMETIQHISPVPFRFDQLNGSLKGYYNSANKEVVIREGMDEIQTMKTAVHEVAHAKIHDRDLMSENGEQKSRMTKEVEAESIAYVVCQYFGLDTSDYSFPYIARWSSSVEMQELRMSMENIRRTAGTMIDSMKYIMQNEIEKQEKLKHLQKDDLILEFELPDGNGYTYFVVRNMGKAELAEELKSYQDIFGENRTKSVDAFLQEQGATVIPWYDSNGLQVELPIDFYDLAFSFRNGISDVEDLSILSYTEMLLNRAEYRRTQLDDEDRDLLVDYAYKFDNKEAVRTLIDEIETAMSGPDARVIDRILENAREEIDGLPDAEIGLAEMHEYGFRDDSVLPLRQDRAVELNSKGVKIYSLNADGSRTLIHNEAEIRSAGKIFGIESNDWKNYQVMEQERAKIEREAHYDENALLDGEGDRYGIYQLVSAGGDAYLFMGMDYLRERGIQADGKDYSFQYGDTLTDQDSLESLFIKFNGNLPTDYFGQSLSVSDVVVLRKNGKLEAYYVDSIGYEPLPDFINQRKMLLDHDEKGMADTELKGIEVEGHEGTWHSVESTVIQDEKYYLMEHDSFGKHVAYVLISESGQLVADELWHGIDDAAIAVISEYQNKKAVSAEQRPEAVPENVSGNEMDKVSEDVSPRESVAVYYNNARYAREHGELDLFHASRKENIACKEAIEQSIRDNFDGMYLKHGAVKPVIEVYGKERVALVLASTLQQKAYDTRFSRANMEWAQSISVMKNSTDYLISSHSAVLDGFVGLFRQETMEQEMAQSENTQDKTAEATVTEQNDKNITVEKKPEISFYVAECLEFPSMGEYHDNIATLQDAMEIYRQIPADRLSGIKGIGFCLDDGSEYDGNFELMSGGTVRKDIINEIPHYKESPLVQKAIADMEAILEKERIVELPAERIQSEPKETETNEKTVPGEKVTQESGKRRSVLEALRERQAKLKEQEKKQETQTQKKGEQEL